MEVKKSLKDVKNIILFGFFFPPSVNDYGGRLFISAGISEATVCPAICTFLLTGCFCTVNQWDGTWFSDMMYRKPNPYF